MGTVRARKPTSWHECAVAPQVGCVSFCLKCLKVLQLQLMPSMDVHCFIAYVYSARLDPIGLFVRATLQAFYHDHLFVAFALGKSELALCR